MRLDISFLYIFFKDYNEEVEKLRREVQRYRMELSNRDNNFNRMFTDGQQLMVDPRAGKIAITQQQVLAAGPTQSKSDPLIGNREKSFSYAFVQSLDESVSTEVSRVAVTFVVMHVSVHWASIYNASQIFIWRWLVLWLTHFCNLCIFKLPQIWLNQWIIANFDTIYVHNNISGCWWGAVQILWWSIELDKRSPNYPSWHTQIKNKWISTFAF